MLRQAGSVKPPERPGVCVKFEIARTLRYTKLSRPSLVLTLALIKYKVRQLNLSRAFARNAGAGRGVRRRETPVRALKSAFGGRNRPKIAKIFARATRAQGRSGGRNTRAQGKKSVRTKI